METKKNTSNESKSFSSYLKSIKLSQEELAKRMGIGRTKLYVLISRYDVLDYYNKAELIKHTGYNDPNFKLEDIVEEPRSEYKKNNVFDTIFTSQIEKILANQALIIKKLDLLEEKLSQ